MARCPHLENTEFEHVGKCCLGKEPSIVKTFCSSCIIDTQCGRHWYRTGCERYRLWKPSETVNIKIRTREDIEFDLIFAKSNHDSVWEKAMAAEKYTLETGRGHDERLRTYNIAKNDSEVFKKMIKEYENELERYDRDPSAYKQKAEQEQKRIIEDHNRHLERIKRVEQSHEWEWLGKCRYDGGNFVGFFSKKCEICGRKRI